MKKFQNEVVFLTGGFIILMLLLASAKLQWTSLWLSLVILVALAMFYSVTFFNTGDITGKFYYFVI